MNWFWFSKRVPDPLLISQSCMHEEKNGGVHRHTRKAYGVLLAKKEFLKGEFSISSIAMASTLANLPIEII